MTCREATQQIFAERDGALGDRQRAALAEHVAGCATCRGIRDGLAVAVETWRADVRGVRTPNAEIEWQKLRRVIHTPDRHSRRSIAAWIAVPLAAAAVAIGLYVAPNGPPSPVAPKPTSAMALNTPAASGPGATSTVIYVDDKSGWTFVWEPTSGREHI